MLQHADTPDVTHVVIGGTAAAGALAVAPNVQVISEQWLVDSSQRQQLLPEQQYVVQQGGGENAMVLLLFAPQLLDQPSNVDTSYI